MCVGGKRGISLIFYCRRKLRTVSRIGGLRLGFREPHTRQRRRIAKKNASNFFLAGFFSLKYSNRWQPILGRLVRCDSPELTLTVSPNPLRLIDDVNQVIDWNKRNSNTNCTEMIKAINQMQFTNCKKSTTRHN